MALCCYVTRQFKVRDKIIAAKPKYNDWMTKPKQNQGLATSSTPLKIAYEISNHLDFQLDFWLPSWFLISKLISDFHVDFWLPYWFLILSTNPIQAIMLCPGPCSSYRELESWMDWSLLPAITWSHTWLTSFTVRTISKWFLIYVSCCLTWYHKIWCA